MAKRLMVERTRYPIQRADLDPDQGRGQSLPSLNIIRKKNKKRKGLVKLTKIKNQNHLQNKKKQISSILLFFNLNLFNCKIKTKTFFNLKGDLRERRFLKRS